MDSNNFTTTDVPLLPSPQDMEVKQNGNSSGIQDQISNDDSEESAVKAKQAKNKELLLEQLAKTPIIEVACKKVGIGRATYYRWIRDDPEFKEKADEAMKNGKLLVNDLAESQLINAIQEGSIAAMTYWLKHHHEDYKTKVEITGKLKTDNDQALNQEQEKALNEAMIYAENIMGNFDQGNMIASPTNDLNAVPPTNSENLESASTSEDAPAANSDSANSSSLTTPTNGPQGIPSI